MNQVNAVITCLPDPQIYVLQLNNYFYIFEGLQLGYTVVFGSYASFLLVRTGKLSTGLLLYFIFLMDFIDDDDSMEFVIKR